MSRDGRVLIRLDRVAGRRGAFLPHPRAVGLVRSGDRVCVVGRLFSVLVDSIYIGRHFRGAQTLVRARDRARAGNIRFSRGVFVGEAAFGLRDGRRTLRFAQLKLC